MNSGQPLLTCRNADLADMVALLQRQHDAKLDVVVPARDMRMLDGELHIDGIGEPVITCDGVTPARGVFRPTLTCDGGIAEKLGIPAQYLRRMRETHPELLEVSDVARNATSLEMINSTVAQEGPSLRRLLLSWVPTLRLRRDVRWRGGEDGWPRTLVMDTAVVLSVVGRSLGRRTAAGLSAIRAPGGIWTARRGRSRVSAGRSSRSPGTGMLESSPSQGLQHIGHRLRPRIEQLGFDRIGYVRVSPRPPLPVAIGLRSC